MGAARHLALIVAVLALPLPAAAEKSIRIPNAQLEPAVFSDLDGWIADNHEAAFGAFLTSCDAILRRKKARVKQVRALERALRTPCERAVAIRKDFGDKDAVDKSAGDSAAREFFEQYFRPVRISRVGESEGFLTGYYEPIIEGSRTPGNGFNVPIYRTPEDLRARKPAPSKISRSVRKGSIRTKIGRRSGGRLLPYYDRTAIENGALAGRGLEICWVRDEIDAFFIHIQGSARVRLRDGNMLRINYAAQNGHPYYAVGRTLIERGIVPAEEMSMDKIRTFISEFPDEGRELMRLNRSYVFFREVEELGPDGEPVGAQGVSLTRDRSIAVDRNLHVYGTPFWIQANLPIESEAPTTNFRRLMLAQDTGGAIVGPARADIYFGAGLEAGVVAGRIRHPGSFFMLVPLALDPARTAGPVPMPLPRPAGLRSKADLSGEVGPVPEPRARPRP